MKSMLVDMLKNDISKFDEMLGVLEGEKERYAVAFAKLCFQDMLRRVERMEDDLDNDWK